MKTVVYDGELNGAYESPAGYDIKLKKLVKFDIEKGYYLFSTGLKLEMPDDVFAIVKARSSTMKRYGVMVLDGVIDSDYRNEVFVQVLVPVDDIDIKILKGKSIAQIVFFNKPNIRLVKGKVENNTYRGLKGFGSSDE